MVCGGRHRRCRGFDQTGTNEVGRARVPSHLVIARGRHAFHPLLVFSLYMSLPPKEQRQLAMRLDAAGRGRNSLGLKVRLEESDSTDDILSIAPDSRKSFNPASISRPPTMRTREYYVFCCSLSRTPPKALLAFALTTSTVMKSNVWASGNEL